MAMAIMQNSDVTTLQPHSSVEHYNPLITGVGTIPTRNTTQPWQLQDNLYSFGILINNATTNSTVPELEHMPTLTRNAIIKVYVLGIMGILSLVGNVMTMWNIYKTRLARRNSRHSWSAIYSLIFHLSIADVLVTGFCIIGEAAWTYTVEWLADEFTCKLVKLCQMFSLYLSTYVLVLIGVDRWIAVKYPMKSLNMAKRCYRMLAGTYIFSFLLGLPQFFIFHIARGPFVEEFYQCVTHGFYTEDWQEKLYTTFTLVITFLLPLVILSCTYISTFRTIASSEKIFHESKQTNQPQTNRQRLIHKAKMKSLRISVVIIIAFLICWTPYNVMMLIFIFMNPEKRLADDLQSAIFFFGMSNSLVNPLIYGAFHMNPSKRKGRKKSLTNNGTYSLNRGDSQRTPSMLTAVTQIDSVGRQVRPYRQASYYRSVSTSCSYHKENASLLSTAGANNHAPSRALTRHSSLSLRNSSSHQEHNSNNLHLQHRHHHHHHHHQHQQQHSNGKNISYDFVKDLDDGMEHHNHSEEIIKNDNSTGSSSSCSGPICCEETADNRVVVKHKNPNTSANKHGNLISKNCLDNIDYNDKMDNDNNKQNDGEVSIILKYNTQNDKVVASVKKLNSISLSASVKSNNNNNNLTSKAQPNNSQAEHLSQSKIDCSPFGNLMDLSGNDDNSISNI